METSTLSKLGADTKKRNTKNECLCNLNVMSSAAAFQRKALRTHAIMLVPGHFAVRQVRLRGLGLLPTHVFFYKPPPM